MRYMLIYEKLVLCVYEPGQTVVLQAKRSFINERFKQFYEPKTTTIFRQEIENKKIIHEMTTGKKHSEIGSLMDVMRDVNQVRKMSTILNKGLAFQIKSKKVIKNIIKPPRHYDNNDEECHQ